MRKALLSVAGLLLAGLSFQPANAWFRGGGWGAGMHEGAFGGHWGAVGGYGHWAAGGVTPSGHAWARPATAMGGTAPARVDITLPAITTVGQRSGRTVTGRPAAVTMVVPTEGAGTACIRRP
jgi:hypothetical protein